MHYYYIYRKSLERSIKIKIKIKHLYGSQLLFFSSIPKYLQQVTMFYFYKNIVLSWLGSLVGWHVVPHAKVLGLIPGRHI